MPRVLLSARRQTAGDALAGAESAGVDQAFAAALPVSPVDTQCPAPCQSGIPAAPNCLPLPPPLRRASHRTVLPPDDPPLESSAPADGGSRRRRHPAPAVCCRLAPITCQWWSAAENRKRPRRRSLWDSAERPYCPDMRAEALSSARPVGCSPHPEQTRVQDSNSGMRRTGTDNRGPL